MLVSLISIIISLLKVVLSLVSWLFKLAVVLVKGLFKVILMLVKGLVDLKGRYDNRPRKVKYSDISSQNIVVYKR